jgi:putative membrane protein
MRYFYLIGGFLLFLATLGFALKNNTPVTLHYYLGLEWHAPLILVMLLAFCAGALAGILACLSLVVQQRRRLLAIQRELHALQSRTD